MNKQNLGPIMALVALLMTSCGGYAADASDITTTVAPDERISEEWTFGSGSDHCARTFEQWSECHYSIIKETLITRCGGHDCSYVCSSESGCEDLGHRN
jgi:hypothetical protein